jgi:hypothetical protein
MNNIEIVKNIKKAVNGDLEATFNLIMQYEGLINKYSRIDGSINLECRDYIVDKLLKYIKKFRKIRKIKKCVYKNNLKKYKKIKKF